MHEDYDIFYKNAVEDVNRAKQTREYGLDMENHPNWFDASYISCHCRWVLDSKCFSFIRARNEVFLWLINKNFRDR